jgi:hypothetical protein
MRAVTRARRIPLAGRAAGMQPDVPKKLQSHKIGGLKYAFEIMCLIFVS